MRLDSHWVPQLRRQTVLSSSSRRRGVAPTRKRLITGLSPLSSHSWCTRSEVSIGALPVSNQDSSSVLHSHLSAKTQPSSEMSAVSHRDVTANTLSQR